MVKLIEIGERNTIKLIRKFLHNEDPKSYQDAFFCKFPKGYDHLVYNIDDLRSDLPKDNIYSVNKYIVAGRFLTAHTLSDIICTGAKPIGFSASFTFDSTFDEVALKNFITGITEVLSRYSNVRYEMGDTNFSRKSHFVGFGWGVANKENLIPRSAGKAGDLIVTTGKIGAGFAGYVLGHKRIYRLSKESFGQVKEIETNPISFLNPIIKCNKLFTGGMDLTDGISDFIVNQTSMSNLGVRINFSNGIVSPVALEASEILGIAPINFFFEGGYDTPRIHVYTIREAEFDKAFRIFERNGVELTIVGKLTKTGKVSILNDGKKITMKLLRDEHKGTGIDSQFLKEWKKVVI
jgi:thiamine monophosphate kinase